jgi:hypothetical protein
MSTITTIADYFGDATNYFEQLHVSSESWSWPWTVTSSWWHSIAMLLQNIYLGFLDFDAWVVNATTEIGKILSISAIQSYFQTWINYATSAYNWVVNAVSNVTTTVNAWWTSTQATVKVWINDVKQWAQAQIDNLATTLTEVQTWWNDFKSKIPSLDEVLSWFVNWWTNILTQLQTWWEERLTDIESFFNSWALSLAPFWEGWQDIREIVFNFFNNPFDWLWDKFTDWFLGGE